MPQNKLPDQSYQKLSSLLDGIYSEARNKKKSYPTYEQIREISERYGNRSELTQGGMKKIEVVEDCITGHPIARASLHCNTTPENIESFLREARITASLEHPNIVPVYDIGLDESSHPFFTMKLLNGDSLQKVLKELSKGTPSYTHHYDLNTRLNIFLKICDAVDYAHSKGVVHLDIKPDNIQLGEFGEVYVCDWGLSKIVSTKEKTDYLTDGLDSGLYNLGTVHGDIKGTPGYMAPEQIRSKLGKKGFTTDTYSLGALLFDLLNLCQPTTGDSIKEVLKNTVDGKIEKWDENLQIPYSLKAVCLKALSVNPSQRYQTVKDLVNEVTAYLKGFATHAEGAGFISQLKLLILRNLKISLTIFTTTILIIVISITFMIKIKENEQHARVAQKEAEKALTLFIKQQQETEKAYNLYSSEKITAQKRLEEIQEREALLQQNLPILISLSNRYINEGRYSHALKLLNTVITNHPANNKALRLIGDAYFYRHDFKLAAESFAKTDKKKFKEIINICHRFSKLKTTKRLSNKLYLQLLNELTEAEKLNEYAVCLAKNLPFAGYRDSFIPLLKKCLKILNPEQKNLKLSVERINGKNYVNISGNKALKNIAPLDRIHLYSLDLSNTGVISLKSLSNKRQLRYLDISNTKITNLLKAVRGFPGLKELTVSKGQLTNSQINILPRGMKITYR